MNGIPPPPTTTAPNPTMTRKFSTQLSAVPEPFPIKQEQKKVIQSRTLPERSFKHKAINTVTT